MEKPYHRERYAIAYGSKYEQTKDLDKVEIAKMIRKDIAAAVKAGEIPKADYSVRIRRWTGSGAIDLKIKRPTWQIFENSAYRLSSDWEQHLVANKHWSWCVTSDRPVCEQRTAQHQEIVKKLKAILDDYNYDGSEIETDYFNVRFYGSVDLDWRAEGEDGLRMVRELVAEAARPVFMAAANDAATEPEETADEPIPDTVPAPELTAPALSQPVTPRPVAISRDCIAATGWENV